MTYPSSSTPFNLLVNKSDVNRPMLVTTVKSTMPSVSQKLTPEHVKQQRPLLIPDRCDGRSAWGDYYHRFEACRDVNGWEDEEAVSYLMASLLGEVLVV